MLYSGYDAEPDEVPEPIEFIRRVIQRTDVEHARDSGELRSWRAKYPGEYLVTVDEIDILTLVDSHEAESQYDVFDRIEYRADGFRYRVVPLEPLRRRRFGKVLWNNRLDSEGYTGNATDQARDI